MYYFINSYYATALCTALAHVIATSWRAALPSHAVHTQAVQSVRGNKGQAYCPWSMYLELALTLENRGKKKIGRFFFLTHRNHSIIVQLLDQMQRGILKNAAGDPRKSWAIPFG